LNEDIVLILLGISGVAATFAGFSGVVAVFGRRAHGEWFLEDRFRLTNMLVTSLGAGLFAFFPLIALYLHLQAPSLWTVSSLLLFVYCATFMANTLPHWYHLITKHPGTLSVPASFIVYLSSGFAALVQVLNATSLIFHREPGPYILGLVLLLVIAGLQFALMVLRPLTAHRRAHTEEEKAT
jgi:hypothetical protein